MMADINRHIMVVWQSVGVVVASFAVMGLVEKRVVTPSIAACFVIAVCAWSLALLIDASYWYNRNLCIIANIEKLFLLRSDLKDVHYYFGAHRKNTMITTLQIQAVFSGAVAILVLLFHFTGVAYPTIQRPLPPPRYELWSPYVVALLCLAYLHFLKEARNAAYTEFLKNSPGASVDTTGVEYGPGHGHGGDGGG
jgi:hypothetical protein